MYLNSIIDAQVPTDFTYVCGQVIYYVCSKSSRRGEEEYFVLTPMVSARVRM